MKFNRMFIVGEDPHAISAARKIAEQAKPGAIICLTDEEWVAFQQGYINILPGEWIEEKPDPVDPSL